jgi:predicted CoA-binding protein
MDHDTYSADYIRDILRGVKTIALVGASNNDVRPSYFVLKYLLDKGYDVTPVNPGLAGQEILGRRVFGALKDIPYPIDMVDIFRNSQAAGVVTDEALALSPLPKVIWMQLNVRNDEAAARAEAAGLKVVMNRCPRWNMASSPANGAGSAAIPASSRPAANASMKAARCRA